MKDKIDVLRKIMEEKKQDALLLTDGYNIHFISGYAGHEGCMLVTGGAAYILTDSRYTEMVTIQAPDYTCIDIASKGYAKTVRELLEGLFNNPKRKLNVGFENLHISYNMYDKFCRELTDMAELNGLDDAVSNLRRVKTADEIEMLAKAEAIGDKAFAHMLTFIEEGMTEKEAALELEYTMKSLGASGLSFDTIVASGKNSSLPHAVPTDKVITRGDFVTMDFGCIYEGYCSDMTRTIMMGEEPEGEKLAVYNTVLLAQTEALKSVKAGAKCSDVDAVARNIIADAGYGDYFGHGLGHGVGLYIHEEPRFSQKCDYILEPGVCITVEPGIYLPGKFGVRIEDMIIVTEDGYRNLAASTKALIIL
ncbi:MAG: aminopeptidase P family protein [Clostridium sp.]|nr:aminopeptidase P family protein [Clostridium sp.]